jgi:glycosyltransferase involved in cell wall biosynthesis
MSLQLSVIVATHNRHERIAHLIDCLQSQDIASEAYEIIVADDGSQPPFAWEGEGPVPVTVIPTGGVERCHARNRAAEAARGDLLVVLDDDLTIGPDFLRQHLEAHRLWPGAFIVGDVHLPREVLLKPFGRFRQEIEDWARPRGRALTDSARFATAQNMSLDRKQFLALGGFDPEVVVAEDQELALVHLERGGKVGFWPAARAVHLDSALHIRGYCRRSEAGSYCHAAWVRKRPFWEDNQEREGILGVTKWGREPLKRSALKELRARLDRPPIVDALFRLADVLEIRAPRSALLRRVYRLLQGIHLQRGYRRGWEDLKTRSSG